MTFAAWLIAAALTITPTSRAMQPGELVVLDITSETPVTAVSARAFNTALTGFCDGCVRPSSLASAGRH